MSQPLQNLPGFRDFFPEACAVRNYIFQHWRNVAFRYGFVEYEGPTLEPTELYTRKSGEEIVHQLFNFQDRGKREVALRPEVTPTLARMVAAGQRHYKKPLKWFQIGPCFRHEATQKGRGREFYQFNCDIVGESGIEADAELVAMAIDLMLDLGFQPGDFKVRLSDRRVWNAFADGSGISSESLPLFLQAIDKLDREKPEITAQKLAQLGTSLEAVRTFLQNPDAAREGVLGALLDSLDARGLAEHVCVDLGVVRGLAYYTGVVFEVFDAGGTLRAVAGGGRYDSLCQLIGGVDLPAAGFAMGDMVLAEFIQATAPARNRLMAYQSAVHNLDAYVIIAEESCRRQALEIVQMLRAEGVRVDFPLAPAKVGRQFQNAEQGRARVAVVVGAEFPSVKIKDMTSRSEIVVDADDVPAEVLETLVRPEETPLLAQD